jgi:hypothetical protein
MTTTKKTQKPMTTHVDHTATAYTGPVKVDASTLASLLMDLVPGGMRGLRKSHTGIDDVVTELAAAVPAYGAAAGISQTTYQSFSAHTTAISQLQTIGAPILKLAEVITETIALHEDGQDQDLGQLVDAIRSTMRRKKSDSVGAPFQKTLAYRAETAKKGVATKKKKAAAKAPAVPAATPAAGH